MKALATLLLIMALPAAAQDNSNAPQPVQNLDQAIKKALQAAASGPYKQITLVTATGGYTGEVVEHSADVILMKIDPEVRHLETGKARMDYLYLATDAVIGVSFSRTE